ncbi:MAG: Gfo/Idh/MocA family oxidoreductase [Phenylobacterium sp.]
MPDRVLRFGVLGLSRGFVLMRSSLVADPRCRLVAAADLRAEARAAFEAEFGANTHETAEALCADPEVDVVYVASPHELHAEHAILAAGHGKHVLVEKPMALDLAGCREMREAARAAGVQLVVGPSHSFDAPIAHAARLIASGDFGRPRMITAMNFTDFLYRPRRPEELDRAHGGGVVFSQAVHQVDVVRALAGAPVKSVRAQVLGWDLARPADGAYQALLAFEGGLSASLSYSGYGRYDTDALLGWIGETGTPKSATDYAGARRRLSAASETDQKRARAYGAAAAPPPPATQFHEHFGYVMASCEHADLQPTATGVEVYGEAQRRTIHLEPPTVLRAGVIDELWDAIVKGAAPRHDGAWGQANLAVCLALLRSSDEGREVKLAELEIAP